MICLFALWQLSLQAKTVVDERNLEQALIEVLYKRIKVTDTLHINTDFKTDYLTLRAGKNTSAFYSANLKTHDSLEVRSSEYLKTYLLNKDMFKAISELEREAVFKNYPTGKVTNHTRHSLCNWIYEEEWEKPIWEITDSTSNIKGYKCLLAMTNYRGRRWYAWFTPEIPISAGPWKLCGLPGLILEARDNRNHYLYSAQIIKQNPNNQVEYFNYSDRFKTNRMASLKERRRNLQESVKNVILSTGTYGVSLNAKRESIDRTKTLPHRNYDFEEIDYPHE